MNQQQIEKYKQSLSHEEILELKRWNTPTIYNGWERITKCDSAKDAFNLEPVVDFMPQMGPMVGYAVTVVCEPSKLQHKIDNPDAAMQCYRYIALMPGPKIVVVQDIDKPETYGSHWGEVNSNRHKALGCVGTITDGSVRDVDEMTNAGFKAMARRMCVGHAHACPIRWGCEVEVFGRKVLPGQIIHADKHGFLAIPFGEEKDLLDAARFMDSNECRSVIKTARNTAGKTMEEILEGFSQAAKLFAKNVEEKFGPKS